jgi:hypothetical protein
MFTAGMDARLGVNNEKQAAQRSVSRPVSVAVLKNLAGEEGLEPSHAGIKIQCLYQLGDSPTQVACSTEQTTQTCRRLRINCLG